MKHMTRMAVSLSMAMVCGAYAADLTEVVNLGNGGAYVTCRSKRIAKQDSIFNWWAQDSWTVLMPMIESVETTPIVSTTTGGVGNAIAYTERCAYYGGYVCAATYERYVNNIAVDLPATNGYVDASLEWNVYFRACGQNQNNDTPEFLGVNRVNVAAGGSVAVNHVLWPDWTPRAVGNSIQRCRFETSTPVLLATKRTSAEGRPDRSRTSDPLAIVGDPIDGINGSVSLDETDLAIPAAGLPLEFRRSYGTVLDGDASFGGVGWSHTYLWRIGESNTVYGGATNRWLVLRAGDDWHWKTLDVANGSHEIDDGWRWTWSFSNGCYEVVRPGGLRYAFNTNGMLAAIRTAASNSLALVYTNLAAGARLSQVRHSDGRALTFAYNATGLLAQVNCAFTNLGMRYEYTESGLLARADRVSGGMTQTTSYAWSDGSQVLTQRVDAAGVARVWEYQGGKGTRSYVGTNRWYETALEYGSNGLNRTHITISRGDTNVVFYQEWDPVRQKVARISARMRPQMLMSLASGSVFTNTFLYQNGDTFGVLGLNPNYQSEVLTQLGHDGNPTAGWSGTEYTRDDYGRIVTAEERAGALDGQAYSKVSLAYDSAGRLTNSSYGYRSVPTAAWSWEWDTNEDVISSITDPESHKAEWDYTNGLVSVERSFPVTGVPVETRYSYTTNGLLASVTNANGHWVRFEHDAYGYPTTVSAQAGPTNWMTWDVLGHLKEIRLPSTEYTTNEPPTMVPRVISFDPDELGRVRMMTWPDGRSETFAFDGIGNVTNHVDAAGRTTQFAWLPTRKLASTTRYLTGASNQAATVGMEYDQQMNVVKVRDELERAVETYQFDLQDRPVKVTNVETQEMAVTYGLGDMVSQLGRFDGSSVSFSYDEGARLKTLVYPDATLDFSYLKNGLLLTASTSLGTVSNSYDGANRLILAQGTGPTLQSSTVTYQLDAVGNPTNTQAAGLGYEVRRTFDAGERISALAAGGVGATFAYNNVNGLLASMTYTNGIVCGYGYDELDRLTSMTWRDASNNVLRSRGYSYTLAGMINRVEMESGERVEYTYDSLDRLTSEKRMDPYGQTLTHDLYEYDLAGNRTKKSILDGAGNPLLTVNYGLSTGNRLASWSVAETDLVGQVDVAGVSSEVIGTNDRFGWLYVSNLTSGTSIKPYTSGTNFWTYDLTVGLGTQKVVAAIRDEAGNTTRVTNEVFLTVVTNGAYQYSDAGCVTNIAYKGKDYSSTISLTWDGQYQLTAVATNGTTAERHGYDALGRRVWMWDAANGTNWMVYDGAQVVADVNSSGGLVRSYVWGPGIDNVLSMTTYGITTNTYYALKDHLGSVLALTDAAGQIVEQYRYDAWGRTTLFDASGKSLSASAVGNRYCWQGREYSFKTGLYYFRARWYDPITGRWLSNDPIGISGGLNQYVFCADNPVNRTDPTGQMSPILVKVITGTILGGISGGAGGFVFSVPEGAAWDVVSGSLSGAAGGGLGSLFGPILGGAVGGAVDVAVNELLRGQKLDKGKVFLGAGVGLGSGLIGSALGDGYGILPALVNGFTFGIADKILDLADKKPVQRTCP